MAAVPDGVIVAVGLALTVMRTLSVHVLPFKVDVQ